MYKRQVAERIAARVAELEEEQAEQLRERLRIELDVTRSRISQLYGFVILNGATEETQEEIKDLVLKEIGLMDALYG